MTTPRSLPHNLDAEKSVVGGVLLHPKALSRVVEHVAPADFYHAAHGAIFQAMIDVDRDGKPVDVLTVAERMRADDTIGKLRAYNGEAYFAELTSSVVTIENITWHAKMVAGKATARRLIEICQEAAAKGYGEYGDLEDFVAEVQTAVLSLGSKDAQRGRRRLEAALKDALKAIDARYERARNPALAAKLAPDAVPTCWGNLDRALGGGWHPELTVIAARPSMGKTSFVMNAINNACKYYGVAALVFSIETPDATLAERSIAAEGNVDSNALRSGLLDDRQYYAMQSTAARLAPQLLDIDDRASPTVDQICSRARAWFAEPQVAAAPARVIVIDHLGLIEHAEKKGEHLTEAQKVGRTTRRLAALARTLRCPVLLLCQLNRKLEGRKDNRPNLTDLRDSGRIEEDARCVIFIHREHYYNRDADPEEATVIIAKQNHGATGDVDLLWRGAVTRFDSLDEEMHFRPAPVQKEGEREPGEDDEA